MAQHITTIQEIRDRTVAQEQHISDDDLLPFDHGTGSNRHRAFTVAEIIEYIKSNKLDGMTIGTTAEIKTSSGNPVIVNFYAIDAGTIEAKTKFKVGGSKWEPGNNQPSISGLYSLEAGNVDSANVAFDTLKPHSSGVNKIEVAAMLVKSIAQAAEKLDLGPTQVNGDAGVTGNLNVIGKVTMEQMGAGSLVIAITDSASVAAAEQTISEMENGRAFIILNTSKSALDFHFSGGAVVSITAKKGVWGIKVADYSYPIDT